MEPGVLLYSPGGSKESDTTEQLDNCGTLSGKRWGWSMLTPPCLEPEPLFFTFIILSLLLILVLNWSSGFYPDSLLSLLVKYMKSGTLGLAAAAAKSLQSCLTLCNPIDGSPTGSSIPGIPQARTLQWVAISFSNAWKWEVKVKSLSRVQLLVTPWTAAYQAPPSMGFSRQEYWSGVPLPSPTLGLSLAYL